MIHFLIFLTFNFLWTVSFSSTWWTGFKNANFDHSHTVTQSELSRTPSVKRLIQQLPTSYPFIWWFSNHSERYPNIYISTSIYYSTVLFVNNPFLVRQMNLPSYKWDSYPCFIYTSRSLQHMNMMGCKYTKVLGRWVYINLIILFVVTRGTCWWTSCICVRSCSYTMYFRCHYFGRAASKIFTTSIIALTNATCNGTWLPSTELNGPSCLPANN